MLKTKEKYLESIKMKKRVFLFGEQIEKPWEHPIIIPTINSIAITYELAKDFKYKELMTAKSNLTGNTINRLSHIHQSVDDLLKKIKMQRFIAQKVSGCFQRCAGWDLANATYSLTYEVDLVKGTNYHERFKKFWQMIQEEDLTVIGSLTDPKGDRSKSPSQQIDPDLHLRIVKQDDKGITVRGAKMHLTGILGAHYCVVMPTRGMKEGEADYSMCFAIPTDHPDLTIIYGRQSCDMRKLDEDTTDVGNFKYGSHESMVIFDDVFIPNDMIFLNGEYEFVGELVNRFAGYHRQSYGGCKPGVGDCVIGAANLCAKHLGIDKKTNIREKITDMIHLNETIYSCGIACSVLGFQREAGNYEMDMLLANNCKLNVTKIPYKIARIADEIVGGIVCNMPSIKDFNNEITGPLMKKYLATCEGVKPLDRFKVIRYLESMTMGLGSVSYLKESLHGAGSPQAQRMMIYRMGKLIEKEGFIKELLDIDKDD